jgi:Ca2+-binding RTX toxin-like protein
MMQLQAHMPLDLTGEGPIIDLAQLVEYSISPTRIQLSEGEFGSGFSVDMVGMSLDKPGSAEVNMVQIFWLDMPYLTISGLSTTPQAVYEFLGEGWEEFMSGNSKIRATDANDKVIGSTGMDKFACFKGHDWMQGHAGADYLGAGKGNDTVRAGKGHDTLIGGYGSDTLYGGEGANTILAGLYDYAENDASVDMIYVLADSLLNPLGNPGGMNRDLLLEIGANDRIFIDGVKDESLSFEANVQDPRGSDHGQSGIGIFADGVLEALVVDSGLTVFQIANMTIGGHFS